MRKTSTYSRKRLHRPVHFNGAEWINAIGRCRQYSDEPVIGSWLPQGTTQISHGVLAEARMAYQGIKDGFFTPEQTDPYDMLAHVVGVSKIRAITIGGEDPDVNYLLPTIHQAEDALRRIRARWEKINAWGIRKGILVTPYRIEDLRRMLLAAGFEIREERVSGNCLSLVAVKPV